MLRFDDIKHIYLSTQTVDLRKGINGYAILVKEVLGKDPYDDSLYRFINSHHNKMKCFYYDETSFWLLYKRLEKGTFRWVKKKITDNGLEAIRKIREEESLDIVNDTFDSAKKLDGDYPPKSHAGCAITYLLNEEKYVRNFLKDPRIELSNKKTERDLIKNFVLVRKNAVFSNTNSGAQTSSNYISIIRPAIMNGLDPEKYLTWILEEMKHINILTDEAIAPLLPYSPTIPQEVKAKGNNKDNREK